MIGILFVTEFFCISLMTVIFKREILTMPKELKEISGTAGLFEPEMVAECLIYNLSRGNYHTCIGLEGWALGVLSAGAAPEKSFLQAAAQVIDLALFFLFWTFLEYSTNDQSTFAVNAIFSFYHCYC